MLPGSFCNFGGTRLHVVAEALLAANGAAPPAGFARAVNYNATVDNWASTPPSVTTAATAGGGTPTAEGDGGIQPTGKTADQFSPGDDSPGTTYGDPGGTGTADEESTSGDLDADAGEDSEGAPA